MATMTDSPRQPKQRDTSVEARRRGAVRTALWAGAVALAVYIAFILSGVVGQ